MDKFIFRKAVKADIPAITEIYNEALLTTAAHYYSEPRSVEERERWFNQHDERNPVFVCCYEHEVIGWASLTKWSAYHAFEDTSETSVYIKKEFRGKGIAYLLLKEVIEIGQKEGVHTIIARILEGNPASIYLHEKLGFEHVGVFKDIGKKFGRYLDLYLMQKMC